MAAGKVCTGFSKPYVALYANNSGTVTYSQAQVLARGVEVSLEPEVSDDNRFYADNITAEVAPGVFTGGTVTLTVDGLLTEAERFIMGLPAEETIEVGGGQVKISNYGDEMTIPYVGIGFIVRYQSEGVVTYAPVVLTKARFNTSGLSAATQEDEIDWQTQELTATLMRDDTENHNWKKLAEDQATEAEAEAVLVAMLGGQPVASADLTALTIGSITLEPVFSPDVTSYTATATESSDTVTATAKSHTAQITITYNDGPVTNGGTVTWETGAHDLAVTVKDGSAQKTYTVNVTKGA